MEVLVRYIIKDGLAIDVEVIREGGNRRISSEHKSEIIDLYNLDNVKKWWELLYFIVTPYRDISRFTNIKVQTIDYNTHEVITILQKEI